MSVHMIRVYIGRGKMSLSDLEAAVNDWVSSNAEWTGDGIDRVVSERVTEPGGSGVTYHAIEVRFALTDAKANLIQKFGDKLQNKVAWYRLGYHRCPHDEQDRDSCSFDPADDPDAESVDWTDNDVTIPAGIPNFA